MTELLFERVQAGGTLTEDVEAKFVEELDRCWWSMTTEEQNDVERLFGEQTLDAPNELGVTDTAIARGTKSPPRIRSDRAA